MTFVQCCVLNFFPSSFFMRVCDHCLLSCYVFLSISFFGIFLSLLDIVSIIYFICLSDLLWLLFLVSLPFFLTVLLSSLDCYLCCIVSVCSSLFLLLFVSLLLIIVQYFCRFALLHAADHYTIASSLAFYECCCLSSSFASNLIFYSFLS